MSPPEPQPVTRAGPSRGAAFLSQMATESARRASAARARRPEQELRRQALDRPAARRLRLSPSGFDLICEVKFRSPSEGPLAGAPRLAGRRDPEAASLQARGYAEAGACAISVLTEPTAFHGSLEHLRRVSARSSVAVLRKDFLVDPYQVWEARAEGADGVLLVARIVDDRRLTELLDACAEADLFPLLESFDRADLERSSRALAGRPHQRTLVGVNNRDLERLSIELERCTELARWLPAGFPAVAESGLGRGRDAALVAQHGYSLALVGTALMRSAEPGELVRSMLRAGRAARAQRTNGGGPA